MIHITAAAFTCAFANDYREAEKVFKESKNFAFCRDRSFLQCTATASLAKVSLPLLSEKNIIEKNGLSEH